MRQDTYSWVESVQFKDWWFQGRIVPHLTLPYGLSVIAHGERA